MESGDWDEAGFEFRSTIMGSTNAKQIENSAYYLAAILLLDAQVKFTQISYASKYNLAEVFAFQLLDFLG